jgi:hypothetical protein
MREEGESQIVKFSCYDVLTLTHFFPPFLSRLHYRRQGLGCVSHVRVRVLVKLCWPRVRV